MRVCVCVCVVNSCLLGFGSSKKILVRLFVKMRGANEFRISHPQEQRQTNRQQEEREASFERVIDTPFLCERKIGVLAHVK